MLQTKAALQRAYSSGRDRKDVRQKHLYVPDGTRFILQGGENRPSPQSLKDQKAFVEQSVK